MTKTKLPLFTEFAEYPKVENVLIMGCGGTGAYVAAHLSRFISVLNQKTRKEEQISLFLADGDIVEIKNLARQHFVNSDISKNKATVLAERYSNAFGIEICVIPKDIENLEDLAFMGENRKRNKASDLIVGCVDNNATRKLIYDWFSSTNDHYSYRSRFWIDCGNEERAGQVICGYAPSRILDCAIQANPKTGVAGEFSLPCVAECYPEIISGERKFNSSLSCAERAISAPQNIQTNVTAATIALNYIQKLLIGEGLKSHGVEFSIDNSFTTKLNTSDNLAVINEQRKRYWEK
jgi:molybdopterin/thiamine biosynthesis adenylyltransferase